MLLVWFILTVLCFSALGYWITEMLSFNPYDGEEKLINSLISALLGAFVFVILYYLFGDLK